MAPATLPLSYLNVFWLLHVIAELPLGIQAFLNPQEIPLADHSASTLLLIQVRRMYLDQLFGAMLLTSSLCAVLVFGLPDYMPGKRAVALHFLVFHGIVSAIFMKLPDGIVTFQLPAWLVDLLPWVRMCRVPTWIAAVHGCIAFLASFWYVGLLTQVASHAAPSPGDHRACEARVSTALVEVLS